MHLHSHTLLSRIHIAYLGHSISRPTDLQEYFALDVALRGCDGQLGFLHVSGGATSQIGLVLFTLSMGEIGALICMKRKTETTFEGAKMVAEDVWVL